MFDSWRRTNNMPNSVSLTRKDLECLRRILQYTSTSDTTVQAEVLRLVAKIDAILTHPQTPNKGASK